MSKCPYNEKMLDEDSGEVLENPIFKFWMEGYESHKLDTLSWVNDKNAQVEQLMEEERRNITEWHQLITATIKLKNEYLRLLALERRESKKWEQK